ncbi:MULTISPECIES: succinylglutamate desuccinylase/aspartoacylase family protein [Flavobacteriaceae]|uniref:succinylglutamate desuccinylase/aspartoacylase family protein n=1 Tax=Flavobacteriaceae TaxID=49546 RepID=UPI001492A356|nr:MULTISPECIES: succinylglutamate desuccinylase/aspartoacylase family protein [Allomuricauda]MDC6367116.1 succinylglutamate desuccinylase/aspartoacylase family protein [Muricauda sp. AC10]
MSKVYSNALSETLEVERIIDYLKGNDNGPTVVFFAGIHGNEPAGIFALKHVLQELKIKETSIQGEIFAIAGNLKALERGVRFQKEDLNRIWFPERIKKIQEKTNCSIEEKELLDLHGVLSDIVKNGRPPFYFMDLHTTSSDTSPFIVLNDSLLNRKYASNYPLPTILGIEEYLEGALLSYINELGYVSLGYESGRHDDIKAIKNCMDFIRYSLVLTGAIPSTKYERDLFRNEVLRSSSVSQRFYEIYFQFEITSRRDFKMLPGFVNFQEIQKGVEIALSNGEILTARGKRQIFMPLYQDQGNEGFYFIRPIPNFLLWFSKRLRRFKVDHLLVKLPGVSWKSIKKDAMLVDQRIARFLAKSFFHLLGYRARQAGSTHLVVKSRETVSKTKDYANAKWF